MEQMNKQKPLSIQGDECLIIFNFSKQKNELENTIKISFAKCILFQYSTRTGKNYIRHLWRKILNFRRY
jgi:hypothetical protein